MATTGRGKSSSKTRVTSDNLPEMVESTTSDIRNAAKGIRESIKAFRQSGVIKEVGGAVIETAQAARDTTVEVRDAAVDINQSGVLQETAGAAVETYEQLPKLSSKDKRIVKHKVRKISKGTNQALRRTRKVIDKEAPKVKRKAKQLERAAKIKVGDIKRKKIMKKSPTHRKSSSNSKRSR
jgi:hypothetical protein